MTRSKFEIMAEIMQNCLSPRGKTHIMYKGNLSFTQTNAYLNMLTSLRLLSQTDTKYATTDKGRQFISAYNELGKIIGMPASPLTKMPFARGMKGEDRLKRIG